MKTTHKRKYFQDWITQKWVVFSGRKIEKKDNEWLLGPFGNQAEIGWEFIKQLADKEQLKVEKSKDDIGLINSIDQFHFSEKDIQLLSKDVIDFYEHTNNYNFTVNVKWFPFFKGFGVLLKRLFSNRLQQLNIPIENTDDLQTLKSEIIHLRERTTNKIKYKFWLRKFQSTNETLYSGNYEVVTIPSGQSCIKAVFPLPNGNATVVLQPSIGKNGELILESAGKKFGESGFYFLLKDKNGKIWAKYIRSFQDKLVVDKKNNALVAIQIFTLWSLKVLKFEYHIKAKIE